VAGSHFFEKRRRTLPGRRDVRVQGAQSRVQFGGPAPSDESAVLVVLDIEHAIV
jgi:hypothetical protein